jgi:hypothetical protein
MNDATAKGQDRNVEVKSGGSCEKLAERFTACNTMRTERLAVVQSGCGELYQSYENCMRENQREPEVCIVTLDKLYICAAEKVAAAGLSTKG